MGGLGRNREGGYQDAPLKYILKIDGSVIKFNIKPSENNNKTDALFAFCILLIGPSF